MVKQGYKQTEIGVVPEDWDVSRLSEIVEIRKEKINPLTSKTVFRCIELENIIPETGRIVGEIYSNEVVSLKTRFYKHDVLFGKLRPYLRKYAFPNFDGVCTSEIWVLYSKYLTHKFLYYTFQTDKLIELTNQSTGTKMPRAEWSVVSNLQIPLPPLSEQEAIAEALSDADAWIESLEQLIAKKRLIKHGAMQELLTPPSEELVLSGAEAWEVKKLGEVIETAQLGGNYQNSEEQNDYPLMKMGNLQRGFISLKKIEYVKGQIPSEKDLLKTNDLLFNTRNTLDLVGKVSIWRNELPKAYFNSNIMRICFNKKFIASNVFVNAVFNTKEFLGKLKDIATGTTSVAAIYTRDLFELEISFPSLSEQERIATILSDMDAELEALEKQLGKARQIKQGMMQELLTGRIRLV